MQARIITSYEHLINSFVTHAGTEYHRMRTQRHARGSFGCISSNGEYARHVADDLGLPLVVTTQGEITMDTQRIYQLYPRINRQLRLLIARADAVTAVSSKTLADLEAQIGHPIPAAIVIPNGTDVQEMSSGRPFSHPARATARAEAASFAAEGDESLGMTVRTADSQEAVFQAAALQIIFEFTLHVRRQRPLTRCQVFDERRVVGFDQLIQERLLRPVPDVLARTRSPSAGVLAGQ